jgi:hypothetical protein
MGLIYKGLVTSHEYINLKIARNVNANNGCIIVVANKR